MCVRARACVCVCVCAELSGLGTMVQTATNPPYVVKQASPAQVECEPTQTRSCLARVMATFKRLKSLTKPTLCGGGGGRQRGGQTEVGGRQRWVADRDGVIRQTGVQTEVGGRQRGGQMGLGGR